MTHRFEYSDIGVECTAEQYASQYPSVIPVLGEKYVYAPNNWMGDTVTIVYVDDRIALGVCKPKWRQTSGTYFMYYSRGPFAGFKYQDTVRPFYRLQPIEGEDS